MKIEIEFLENETENVWNGWKVSVDEKFADGLAYEEMIGLVISATMPEARPTLNWLKTQEQHDAWRNSLKYKQND